MPIFELADSQLEILKESFEMAKAAEIEGEKGMIIGQFMTYVGKGPRPHCKFYFVPNKPALKIIKILDDHIKKVRGQ